MNKKLSGILGLIVCSLTPYAYATLSVPAGWFVEADAGSSSITGKSYPGDASSSGLGGNVNVGYKFFPYFAVEAGYTRYSNTSIDSTFLNKKAATDKHYSYDIAARGILPIGFTGVEFFGKVGASRIASSMSINNDTAAMLLGLSGNSHSKTGVFIGGGVQYYAIPEVAILVEWARAYGSSSTGTGSLLSGGLSLIVD